jgi:hypothetical protein
MRFQLKEGALELAIDHNVAMSSVDHAIASQLSSAISLKRIADALEGMHKRRELTNLTDMLGQLEMTLRGRNNVG